MTRENKLALVIGFGLLLLAGILVSDHLSAQQRMEEDPLQAVEPRWVPDQEILQFADTKPVETKPAPTQPERIATFSSPPAIPSTSAQEAPRQIVLGGTAREASRSSGSQSNGSAMRFHYVKSGENLSNIAKKYFGDPKMWVLIERHNPDINADALQIGTRLTIPNRDQTVASSRSTRTSETTQRATRARTTVVKEGETPSDIARRELGDGSKWPKLHEANRNTLPNADQLKPGMILKVPTTIN